MQTMMFRPQLLLLVLPLACVLATSTAEAAPKKKRYHFQLAAVTAKPVVKADVGKAATPRVEGQVKKAFESHPQLVAKLVVVPDRFDERAEQRIHRGDCIGLA